MDIDWTHEEQVLSETARDLIGRGLRLQSMDSLTDLERWDDDVNALLERINADVKTGRFASRRLQRLLDQLIHLYTQVLAAIAELESDKASQSATLHEARWAING